MKYNDPLLIIKLIAILLIIIIYVFIFIYIQEKYFNNIKYIILKNSKKAKEDNKKIEQKEIIPIAESDYDIYSFKAIYRTTKPNEKVILINKIYNQYLKEVYLDNKKINTNYGYLFLKPGEYQFRIIIYLEKINSVELMFQNIYQLISIKFKNEFFNSIKSVYGISKNCINLIYVNFSNSFSKVINFSYAFQNCVSFSFLEKTNIISNETLNISCMFSNCSSLQSIDLSNFDTTNIKDMSGLFYNCSSLGSINLFLFKTEKILYMKYMFAECTSLSYINLKNLQLPNIKEMSFMFKNCVKLTSIELPMMDNKKTINKTGLFEGCESLTKKYDICIIGYWFWTNFGSLATYYGLHQAVKNMGYSILMIDNPLAPLRESSYDKCHPITIGRDLYNISEQKALDKIYLKTF